MAASEDNTHDVVSLLSSPQRDFLLRNNGDQVKIESLKGKKLGVYFSASWCGPCRKFTPTLVEAYNEVVSKGDFEVVFASADEDEESFKGYFSKMPWLAIPFSDSETRSRLDELFHVRGIPHLVILEETGKVVTEDGVDIVREYGVDAYPFTSARIQELRAQEEEARRNQSVRSLLISPSRDFVISSDGNNILVSELEGKTVGLYFSLNSFQRSSEFTPKLVEVYEKLKAKGENFEVVLIPLDEDEESFKKVLESVPWLSLPFKDKFCGKLAQYFELSTLPTLVIIGPDGKTLNPNVAEAIEDHGVDAYPFTPEKFVELDEILKAREAAQTLESVLVSEDRGFVIGKDGVQIPVSELKGKVVLLYFSAHWCPPCRAFLPKLVDAYQEIKAKASSRSYTLLSTLPQILIVHSHYFDLTLSPLHNTTTSPPTIKMVNFHINEPHPSASAYMYSGRGGAGNAMRIKSTEITPGPTASGPASRTKLPPPPSNAFYATGRGGAGNMKRSERAIFSFDEELQQQERLRTQQAPVYHIGRGGAGNLVDEMKPRSQRQNSASSTASSSSVESEKDGVRRSMEHAWQRLSRQFSH